MLGADGALWVVKFRNNPQGERVLANEFLATRIAEALGLTVPKSELWRSPRGLRRTAPRWFWSWGAGEPSDARRGCSSAAALWVV